MQLLTSPLYHLTLWLPICLLATLDFHEKTFAVPKLDVPFVLLGNQEAESGEFAFLRDRNNIVKTIFILVSRRWIPHITLAAGSSHISFHLPRSSFHRPVEDNTFREANTIPTASNPGSLPARLNR